MKSTNRRWNAVAAVFGILTSLAANTAEPLGRLRLPEGPASFALEVHTNAMGPVAFDLATGEHAVLASAAGGFQTPCVLIDDHGPLSAAKPTPRDQAQGPGWRFARFDVTEAFSDRVRRFERSYLYLEPDLFVVWDHVEGVLPVSYEFRLQLPAAAEVDPVWGDVRLKLPAASLQVHAPGEKKRLRTWKRPSSSGLLGAAEGFETFSLASPGRLQRFDVVTVFCATPATVPREYAFRLLESSSAVGVRVHRDGLPALIAFRTADGSSPASLTSFEFQGPVGVDVFKPRTPKP